MRIDWTKIIVSEITCIAISNRFNVDILFKYGGMLVKLTIDSVYDNFVFKDDSKGFYSKNGMILNVLGISYGCGILSTISICMT